MRCAVIHGGVWQADQYLAEGVNLIRYDEQGREVVRPLFRAQVGEAGRCFVISLLDASGQEEVTRETAPPPPQQLALEPEAGAVIAQLIDEGWTLIERQPSHRGGDRLEVKVVYLLEREGDDDG
jgi:hypothetical protein